MSLKITCSNLRSICAWNGKLLDVTRTPFDYSVKESSVKMSPLQTDHSITGEIYVSQLGGRKGKIMLDLVNQKQFIRVKVLQTVTPVWLDNFIKLLVLLISQFIPPKQSRLGLCPDSDSMSGQADIPQVIIFRLFIQAFLACSDQVELKQ